ncbi:MAG: hypothetical protein GEU79_10670 [Acidimicrobiia bacterium]|nr:hypothetical protein [Acidimicrobiia bacterium]
MMPKRWGSMLLMALVAVTTIAGSVAAQEVATTDATTQFVDWDGRFSDDDGDVHELNIEAIANAGITRGCGNEDPLFCPDDSVTRGQMAAFLVRALNLPASNEDAFTDDNNSVFQADIQALAAAGITRGCNPPENTLFCPNRPVIRGEMATFLVRGLELPASNEDAFTDDNDSVFQADIQALAAAGITRGCNPPENTLFCPNNEVLRSEMATFLTRGLELQTLKNPLESGDALLIDQTPPAENVRPQPGSDYYQVIYFVGDADEFWGVVPYSNGSWGAYTFSGGFFILDGYVKDIPNDPANQKNRIVDALVGFGWPQGVAEFAVTGEQ